MDIKSNIGDIKLRLILSAIFHLDTGDSGLAMISPPLFLTYPKPRYELPNHLLPIYVAA